MELPSLHRLPPDRRGTSWRVGQTALKLSAKRSGWRVWSLNKPAARWIQQTGLAGQRFDTRKDALTAVAACLHAAPLREVPSLRMTAYAQERWRTADGHWQVRRRDDGSMVASARSELAKSCASAAKFRPIELPAGSTLHEMGRRLHNEGRRMKVYV